MNETFNLKLIFHVSAEQSLAVFSASSVLLILRRVSAQAVPTLLRGWRLWDTRSVGTRACPRYGDIHSCTTRFQGIAYGC